MSKLDTYMDSAVATGRRESHSGAAKTAHDEAAAERTLELGLEALGLRPERLEDMKRNAPEKQVLAWWLRQGTTISLRWLSQRLVMGHYTRVSQAVSLVEQQPSRTHENLKRMLPKKGSVL